MTAVSLSPVKRYPAPRQRRDTPAGKHDSSATVSANSGRLRSTPWTQKLSRFSRFTRWLPMSPPALP